MFEKVKIVIPKPAVYLGEVLIDAGNVTWINETTLTVVLPQTLGPNIYSLKVVNPAGQSALLPNAVWIGRLHFLPVLMR